ncbi:trichohyalin-like isoform X1 [Antennarius striatus]|uniref:trichohyalin-like isoform X1 n=1 Tax=Antennarius striatus TaxID=241820 RepID=UPI0035AE5DF2
MEGSIQAPQTKGVSNPKPPLGPKPLLAPKPFSLQKNTSIHSIHAPKIVTATSKPTTTRQSGKSEATGVPRKTVPIPAQKPSVPDSKPNSHVVPRKEKPKIPKETKVSQPDSHVEKPVPVPKTTPSKEISKSESIVKDNVVQTKHKAPTDTSTSSEQKDQKKKEDESQTSVSQKLEESNNDISSTSKSEYRWGSTRKRLSMELTSMFENSGPPQQSQPSFAMSSTSSKDCTKKPKSSNTEQNQMAADPTTKASDEGGPSEEYGSGGSIKNRISLLFDSASRPEVPIKKEEPEIINSTGGVRARIKSWDMETSFEDPKSDRKPQVVPRPRPKSFGAETPPAAKEALKAPPVEPTATDISPPQAVDPPAKVSPTAQPQETQMKTSEGALVVDESPGSHRGASGEHLQNEVPEVEVKLRRRSPSGSQAAAVADQADSEANESTQQLPKKTLVKRRSVRFGVVERDDGMPPLVLGSESDSSEEEVKKEGSKNETEEHICISSHEKEEAERLKHLEFEKRRRAEEAEEARLRHEEELKQKEEEEEREKEKARQREEKEREKERLQEEEIERQKKEEWERERLKEEMERLRKEELERERQVELMLQKQREEERERAKQKEERLKQEQEERERERLREERERERLREEEMEKERQIELMLQKQREEERERAKQKEERLKQEQEERERERLRKDRERERLREEEMEKERQIELMLQKQREEERERAKQKEERLKQELEEREQERLREERERERLREEKERERLREERERERLREERERERLREEKERERLREERERERLREEMERERQLILLKQREDERLRQEQDEKEKEENKERLILEDEGNKLEEKLRKGKSKNKQREEEWEKEWVRKTENMGGVVEDEKEKELELMWQRKVEEDRERARQKEESLRREEMEKERSGKEEEKKNEERLIIDDEGHKQEEKLRKGGLNKSKQREEEWEKEWVRKTEDMGGVVEDEREKELELMWQRKVEEDRERARQKEENLRREEMEREGLGKEEENQWKRHTDNLERQMQDELERKQKQDQEEKPRMEKERERECLTTKKGESTLGDVETSLISFDSEHVPPKSPSLCPSHESIESTIEVPYEDFSVKRSLIDVDFDDFSVKPKSWGSQAKVETSETIQSEPGDLMGKEEQGMNVLVPLSIGHHEEEPEQVEKTKSPEPILPMERKVVEEQLISFEVEEEKNDRERKVEVGQLISFDGEEEELKMERKVEEEQLISFTVEEEEKQLEESKEDKVDEDDHKEVQVSTYSNEDDRDPDVLIDNEPDRQNDACEQTTEHTSEDESSRTIPDNVPEVSSEDPDTTDFPREIELPPFPENSTRLLDTSAQRARADLGKSRRRARPSRSLRTGLSQKKTQNWRICDSSENTEASSKQTEIDSEDEQPKQKMARSPPSSSQRVPMFPGLSPAALLAQIKKKTSPGGPGGQDETEEDETREEKEGQIEEETPSPFQPSRSARSPAHLAGAARVLPPLSGADEGAASCPSWLKELKSKKRMNQQDDEV